MSGCDRILARLERGPATAAELYAETYCVVHSRVADLRKRGHDIESFRIEGKTGAASYGYRLKTERTAAFPVPGVSSEQLACDVRSALVSTGALAPHPDAGLPSSAASAPVEQLSLEAA